MQYFHFSMPQYLNQLILSVRQPDCNRIAVDPAAFAEKRAHARRTLRAWAFGGL
jgi:hypothetical protein